MKLRLLIALVLFTTVAFPPKLLAASPTPTPDCKRLGDVCSATSTLCSAEYECKNSTVSLKRPPQDQVDCSAQGITTKGGNVTSCVGGFLTKESLRNNILEVGCAGRELILGITTFCWQIPGTQIGKGLTTTIDMSTVSDSNIGQDDQGRYFTCFTGQSSDPNVHDIFFNYKSKNGSRRDCTSHIYTIDKNTPCLNDVCNTALGFISIKTPTAFVSTIMGFAIGIAGTLALLLMLYGLFIIITAAANDKAIKSGQDIITSAVSGLLFIILSVIMLKIIGVDILHIPGL